jgi:hypothetical protein
VECKSINSIIKSRYIYAMQPAKPTSHLASQVRPSSHHKRHPKVIRCNTIVQDMMLQKCITLICLVADETAPFLPLSHSSKSQTPLRPNPEGRPENADIMPKKRQKKKPRSAKPSYSRRKAKKGSKLNSRVTSNHSHTSPQQLF